MMKEYMRKEYSCKYNSREIAIYVYERDYSLMNKLVAEALKQELKNNKEL